MNTVYITQYNSRRILQKLDLKKIDPTDEIYKTPIYLFNQVERAKLLAYKELMMHPAKVIGEMFIPVKTTNRDKFVYNEDLGPCYHLDPDCERLNAEFHNWLIPEAIREKGPETVERYRQWFKANLYLLDKDPEAFEAKISMVFGVKVGVKEIVYENSGTETFNNRNLSTLTAEIDKKLKEAGRFYYASEKNTIILSSFGRYAYLWRCGFTNKKNYTRYSDEEVLAFLKHYDQTYKTPIMNMLYDYYRVRFNPRLSMEGYLLDTLGFRPCSECC